MSCRPIEDSIVELYQSHDVRQFNYDSEMSLPQIDQLVHELKSFDRLVICLHKPHPYLLLARLAECHKTIEVIVHVYGDFVIYAQNWLRIEKSLSDFKRVSFIAASHAHAKMIEKLVATHVAVVPFACEKDVFYFDDKERLLLRRKLGFKNEDVVFVYSGRISRQKNILQLISLLEWCRTQFKFQVQLLIVGEADSMGVPYIGLSEIDYEYEYQVLSKINASDFVHFVEKRPREEMRQYYNAADLGIFLSTHNDEDFGMAPLESLMCGTPTILTRWGGFKDFEFAGLTHYTSVKYQKSVLSLDMSQTAKVLLRTLSELAKKPNTSEQRQQFSQSVTEKYSLKTRKNLLDQALSKKQTFQSFSRQMVHLSQRFESNSYAPFVDVGSMGGFSKFYGELYESYF